MIAQGPRAVARLVGAAAAAIAVVGCGGTSGTSSGTPHSPLVVAAMQPFTGPDAFYGASVLPQCKAAAATINRAGGVLGHPLTCTPVDTIDPADALPVVNRMIASTSNLAFGLGPTSGAQEAVEPELIAAHLVHASSDSSPAFDHQTSVYNFRLPPSDAALGVALAAYSTTHGYRRVATVFSKDAAAQTAVPQFNHTYAKLGGTLTTSLTLANDQTSYRTEISHLLATKPEAIVTEMEPQTAATFFSQLLQLNNNQLIPVIASSRAVSTDWITAVVHAVGKAQYERYITAVGSDVPPSGPGHAVFAHAMLSLPVPAALKQGWTIDPFAEWTYDGVVLPALAMSEAKTTKSSVWAPFISKIANGVSGAVTVGSFAEGKAAIARGKTVHYVGASGPLALNQWNNNSVAYSGFRYTGSGVGHAALAPTGAPLTPSQLAAYSSK